MKQIFSFLTLLFIFTSCKNDNLKSEAELKNKKSNLTPKNSSKTDSIRFEFSAQRINSYLETVEIKAMLINDRKEFVYFLSSTCDGEQYSLIYDEKKFRLSPTIFCNASFPTIIKIGPKKHHDFIAHFNCDSKENKIKLGFNFYPVRKSLDSTEINLAVMKKGLDYKQNIIWSIEQQIK